MTPHDHAPPVSPSGGKPGSAAAAHPPSGRSGSQNRQRTESLQIAMTPDELAEVIAMATASGLSRSSYCRAVLLGTPGPPREASADRSRSVIRPRHRRA
jgi:hypothetical protein